MNINSATVSQVIYMQAVLIFDTLAAYMGHADSKVTREIYNHLTKKANREVAQSVDNFYGEKLGFTAIVTAIELPQGYEKGAKTDYKKSSGSGSWFPMVVVSKAGIKGRSL